MVDFSFDFSWFGEGLVTTPQWPHVFGCLGAKLSPAQNLNDERGFCGDGIACAFTADRTIWAASLPIRLGLLSTVARLG